MAVGRSFPVSLLMRFAARLRFPALFAVTAVLFIFDVLVPDIIPFVDEILLGLVTLLLGSWKREQPEEERLDDPGRVQR